VLQSRFQKKAVKHRGPKEDSPMTHSWFQWRSSGLARKAAPRSRRTSRPRRSFVPHFLVLEDRTVLSTLTVLNNADSGAGSLRETITAAQSEDTIVFDPSLMHETITLSTGPLALSSNLTIDGPGAELLAISGNHVSQLFTLSGSAQVTLADLTLTGGVSSQGGAVFIGGTAALALDSDILSGNQAVGDANSNALGGAVYNSAGASLTVDNTVFVNNQTNGTKNSFGGAITNGGTLVITGATFTANTSLGSTSYGGPSPAGSQGGAIGNLDGSTATINSSSFTGNQALGSGTGAAVGGAIANEDFSHFPFTGSGVTCNLSQCIFENNTAKGGSNAGNQVSNGGAIENEPGVNMAVLNSLVTGNHADSGGGLNAFGGAIDDSPGVAVTIADSQFISNSAIGSGVGAIAAAGAVDNYQTMTISNCLFTGNSAVAGPMADGVNTFGEALGGAIYTGEGLSNGVTVILTLSNSTVAGNQAIGGTGGSTLATPGTDVAAGGGITNINGGTLSVVGCTITGNQAIGGASAHGRGANASGGGIDNHNRYTLNLTNSTVSTNLCQGGTGASGAAGGSASGGGISNENTSVAILTNSTLSLNGNVGGAGGAGANGGAAIGGGISNAATTYRFGRPDASSLIVSNCQIIGDTAQGGTEGSSAVGGDGLGGGIFVGSGTVELEGVLVSGNRSQGGVDSQQNITGKGLGGGVYVDPSATATMNTETLIAGNQASKDNNDVWGTITVVP
jgi:hypothetical protein